MNMALFDEDCRNPAAQYSEAFLSVIGARMGDIGQTLSQRTKNAFL
jgi:hypothetical protein